MNRLKALLLTAVVALAAVTVPVGCSMLPSTASDASRQIAQISDATTQAQAAITAALERKAEIDRIILQLPIGKLKTKALAVSNSIAKEVRRGQQYIDKAEVVMSSLKDNSANAETWGDLASGVITTASGYVPQPYGGLLVILGSVVGALVGNKRGRRKGAVHVAKSIEAAKVNGVVDFTEGDTVKRLKLLLGTDGRAAVNKAQQDS